jgi:hypothetical protein
MYFFNQNKPTDRAESLAQPALKRNLPALCQAKRLNRKKFFIITG